MQELGGILGLSNTLNLSTCFRAEGTGSEILGVKERCDWSTPRERSGNCRVCSYGTIIAGFDRCRFADGSIALYHPLQITLDRTCEHFGNRHR